ncbi:hypothetical protein AKJ09_10777 [Labilithrix luteola]|uniref:PEGA domain-containing protein n=1 Tax=Labilithrix luteola TaxID=1391654 RepID=A0A0K1QEC5_9BACT|nr:hypothetical protein [Labilithrix luteola]AKV04114.1 hypothetical protein AKJ09_10777 [Labilithrix luteola]
MKSVVAAAVLVVAALATLVTSAAHAQSTNDEMLAQSLFDEGRTLMDAGRFSEACPKLAESQRLDPGAGTLLNLAICHESEGRLATAYTELNASLSLATKDGRKDREAIARKHLADLAPRIPHVSIHVTQEEDGLEVRLDGGPVRKPAWDVVTGVDPGFHFVEAEAPGFPPYREQILVHERENKVIDIPSLRAPQASAQPAADARVMMVPSDPNGTASSGRTHPLRYVATAVGTVSLIGATVAGVGWLSARTTRDEECIPERSFCTSAGLDAVSRERTYRAGTLAGLGLGVVSFASLAFIPRTTSAPKAQAWVSPRLGGATVDVKLAF